MKKVAVACLPLFFLATPLWATLSITTTSCPDGVISTTYNCAVAATGGQTPYSWSKISGSFPPGVTITSLGAPTYNGSISGTPTSTGTYSFTVQVQDNLGHTANAALSISIYNALTIATTTCPSGFYNEVYSCGVVATGGKVNYTWSKISGSFPSGVTITSLGPPSNNGSIAGTPTQTGTFSFTVQVQDSASPANTATKSLSLTINYPPVSFSTTLVPSGTSSVSYSASVAATGGNGSITYSLSSGSLPGGLSLSSGGTISGTPTSVGESTFVVEAQDTEASPQSATRPFFIGVFPSLTTYNGLSGSAITPCTATGYFQLKKVNHRWMFADPGCKKFWLFGVQNGTSTYIDSSIYTTRYGTDSNRQWENHSTNRIMSWGFNTWGEYAQTSFYDGNSHLTNIPFVLIVRPSVYAESDGCTGYSGDLINDVIGLLPSNMTNHMGYQYEMMDIFDPMWSACASDAVSNAEPSSASGGWGNQFMVGITMDESDEYWALGGNADPYVHMGYAIATAKFQGSHGSDGSHHSLFSKYAWTCGISGVNFGYGSGVSYLQRSPGGYANIAALNSAWGTSYTSFCDDGSGGWGSGTGVLDEDGTHIGCTSSSCDPFGLTGVPSAVQTDVNGFLHDYAKRTFAPVVTAIRNVDSNHLIFSMNKLGGHSDTAPCTQKARSQVLVGMQDAGAQAFIACYGDPNKSSGSLGTEVATDIYVQTGLPSYVWYSVSAEADSYWYPCTSGEVDFPTQEDRGAGGTGQYGYGTALTALWGATSTNSDYPIIGVDWWGLTDDNLPPAASCGGEHTDFGLITDNDNAYDGNCAIASGGTDAFSYACGGEDTGKSYGNFLSSVTSTNVTTLQSLQAP